MGYLYVASCILFTVYGQLVLKWQVNQAGQLPPELGGKLVFLFSLFLNPWILSGFLSAFLAALSWMAAMTSLDLSRTYPFMGLAFVFVMVFAVILLHEPLTAAKVFGTLLVVAGLILLTR